jgi:hypothetical protein
LKKVPLGYNSEEDFAVIERDYRRAKLRLLKSIFSPPTLRPHMRIRCRTGGKKKKKKTAPNEIAQLTDYVISRTKNVLRFWFVVKIKLKRRGLPDTDQAEKKSWSRDGLEEREVVSTTNPIYSH